MTQSEIKSETDYLFATHNKTKLKSVSTYQLSEDLDNRNKMSLNSFGSRVADINNNEVKYKKIDCQRRCLSTEYKEKLNAIPITNQSEIINEIQYSCIPIKDTKSMQHDKIHDLPIKLVQKGSDHYKNYCADKDVSKNIDSKEINEKFMNFEEKEIDDQKIIQNPTQNPTYVFYYTDTATYVNIFNRKRIDLSPVYL